MDNVKNNSDNEITKLRSMSGKSIYRFSDNYDIPVRTVKAWEVVAGIHQYLYLN